MQYHFDGVFHRLARVTGPTHNFLALALTDDAWEQAPGVDVLDVDATEWSTEATLDRADVVQAVLDGVTEANRDLGCTYAVRRVQFVRSDSSPAATYRVLAREIVTRAAAAQRTTHPSPV